MSMLKKLLAVALTASISAGAAIAGTVAYLQDTESDVNVMTLGNVDIEQHEYQRADGVDYNDTAAKGDLVPFEQGQPLYPAVPEDGTAYTAEATDLFFWGDYVYSGTAGNGLWNDDKLSGAMDKFVFVENTGKSDAYFRTIIAFECPEGMEYSEGSDKEFMMNVNGSTLYKWENIGYDTIDGVRYLIMEATYQNPLKPGQQAHPSLLQVVMTHNATNEDMEKLGDSYEILVKTQAVQTAGFDNAKVALDTAFGKTADKHPWANTTVFRNDGAVNLNDALKAGDVIVSADSVSVSDTAFDGNGSTVTLAGVNNGTADEEAKHYGYLVFAPTAGAVVEVEDLTVTGSGYVEFGHHKTATGGTYTVNNLTIEDMTATLCVNNGGNNIAAAFGHYGTAILTDCTMTGTVAAKDGYTAYDAAFVNGTTTTIVGGKYGKVYLANQAHVTVTSGEIDVIDSYAISTKNLGSLTIKAGAKVGTINLYDTGKYKATLTIEDGATVDKIVYNGNTYTAATWPY